MKKEMSQSNLGWSNKNLWRPFAAAAIAGSIGFADSREYHGDLESAYQQKAFEHVMHIGEEIDLFDQDPNVVEEVNMGDELIGPVDRPLTNSQIRQIVAEAFYGAQSSEVFASGNGTVAPLSEVSGEKVTVEGESIAIILADCETGDGQVGPPYYVQWRYDGPSGFDGAYQFLPSTWSSLESGKDYEFAWQAPPEVQTAAMQELLDRGGWNQWPNCSARMREAGYID